MEIFVYVLYTLAALALIGSVIRSIWRRLTHTRADIPEPAGLQRLRTLKAETLSLLEHEATILVKPRIGFLRSEVQASHVTRVAELAMDMNVGILEATRSSEKRLTKAPAEELLKVLRDELAIAPADVPTDQLLQSVRAKLIRLTEMMVEAQVSLVEVKHQVIDIESLVRQLPRVLDSHRENILSLANSIDEMSSKYVSKPELKVVEKEVEILRWVFSLALGVVLALLGWMITKR